MQRIERNDFDFSNFIKLAAESSILIISTIYHIWFSRKILEDNNLKNFIMSHTSYSIEELIEILV